MSILEGFEILQNGQPDIYKEATLNNTLLRKFCYNQSHMTLKHDRMQSVTQFMQSDKKALNKLWHNRANQVS